MTAIDDAKAIVAHGPNTAYISRGSSQHVRDVMARLIAEHERAISALKVAREAIWSGGDTIKAIATIDAVIQRQHEISPALDNAISDELKHRPKDIIK